MRKPRRLTAEQLAPYQIEIPRRIFKPELPELAPSSPPWNWSEIFGNDHPVELEVGFGKGLFLLTSGLARPDLNFFGIEIVRKYQLYATTRIAIRKMPNVKTACGDAKRILNEFVPPGSVSAVHVYFPDPWWKTRHKKRLLFTPDFADLVCKVLKPAGILYFVTDVQDYFQMVTAMLSGRPAFHPLPPPVESAGETEMDYLTNFERKFRREGRPIYRSAYRQEVS